MQGKGLVAAARLDIFLLFKGVCFLMLPQAWMRISCLLVVSTVLSSGMGGRGGAFIGLGSVLRCLECYQNSSFGTTAMHLPSSRGGELSHDDSQIHRFPMAPDSSHRYWHRTQGLLSRSATLCTVAELNVGMQHVFPVSASSVTAWWQGSQLQESLRVSFALDTPHRAGTTADCVVWGRSTALSSPDK